MYTYSRSSLFMVVTICKVAVDTEIAHTELLLLGEVQVRFLQASGQGIFLSRDQYITKDTLFNILLIHEQ